MSWEPGNNLGSPIATGRTAEIYAWQEGQVLKLFYGWFEPEAIQHEARIAQAVGALGLPAPAVGELIRVKERYGLVYQRVEGPSMWEAMARQPWNGLHYARQMAELHAGMHIIPVGTDIPSQRQKLMHKIRHAQGLPARLQSKTLAALEALPYGDRLCHGDFHPANILMSPQGAVIIDWSDVSRGNPLADLARTTILALGAAETGQIQNPFQKVFVRIFHAAYLRQYFKLRPGGKEEYQRWLSIVAAARMSEGISELENWLVRQVEK